jgi:hypothetical protein
MMEKQMELFARGGLKDEGGMIDEESGNRVPIGGTREGVRDDIEANVSEGEFILSEDVTRYHGLEKLMNLRQEAKMGLKRMEAMGQMGNSDEATMPDDLPFGMDDLIIVASGEPDDDSGELNMAVGGLTTGTTNVVRTGQEPVYTGGQPVAPTTTATRRLTPEITRPVRTTVDFKKLMGEASIEYKEYRNAAGNNIMIPFIGGVATFPIPDGYFLYTGEGSVGTGTTPTDDIVADTNAATQEIRSRGSDDRTEVDVRPKPVDYDNISNEELLKLAQDQTGTKGTLVKVAMGFMGPLGIFGMMAMSHQSKKIQDTINKRIASGIIGNDLKGEFTEVLGLLKKGSGGLIGGVVDFIGGLLGKTPEEIEAAKKTTAEVDKKTNPDQPLFVVNPRSGVTELTISVPEAVQSVLKDVPANTTDQQMTEMLTSKVVGNVTEGERQALANAAFAPSGGGKTIAEFDLAREAMADVAPVGAVEALQGTPLTTYRDMSPEKQAERASTVSVAGVGAKLPTGTTTAVTPELTGLEQLEAVLDTSTKLPPSINATPPGFGATTPVDTSTYTAPSVTGIIPDKSVVPAVDTSVYTAPSSMAVPESPSGYAAYSTEDFLKDAGVSTVKSPVAGTQGYADYTQADFLKEAGVSPSLATQTETAFTGVNNKDAASRSADIEKDSIGEFELKIGQPVTDIEGLMPPQVGTTPTYTGVDYTLPSSTGIIPAKPVVDTSAYTQPSSLAMPVVSAEPEQVVADTYIPDATQSVQGGFGVTPEVSLDITAPKLRPAGLGAKTDTVSTTTETYKAGDSNQATAWQNLPDANLAQAADLNRRYATTGGTAVDGYAVGAITDGKSQGVYADSEGFALRDEEDRVVYRNDDFDVPVVKSTVYERVFEGADKYKPATNFDESKTSIASTDKKTAVTPAKKNQLSKTAKAKIGTDASGGDPNMAGAVWTSQPGTNVLTRTFPKKDDKKPAPVTTTKKSSSGGGGSSSSGGGSSKIVCTAMNESYGFGSYRQAVWLKYSNNNLTKEHEVGYHTLFLPLVELAYQKDYKYVRKTLENIARHRTADLRAEMQNKKRDKLGRFYRAILEPICYLVGAYKMFRNK